MGSISKSSNDRKRFVIKATAILAVVLGIGAWFADRFYIGFDVQEYSCLPYTMFIVDTKQTEIKRGQYFAYTAKGMQPAVQDGMTALKQAVGVPGDLVTVGAESTSVNGTPQPNGLLRHVDKLDGVTLDDLTRDLTVPEGELFAMGTEPPSFDSRYWGTVKQDQIQGRAYPIF